MNRFGGMNELNQGTEGFGQIKDQMVFWRQSWGEGGEIGISLRLHEGNGHVLHISALVLELALACRAST